MRKTISILLLSVFLYNMLGYQVIFYFRTQAIEQEINRTIDQGAVDESQLRVFKVPVPVYHQTDQGFERVNGSLEYEGRFYEMVKRKLENDTIYIYCLRNEQKRELVSKLNDHVQMHVANLEGHKPAKPEKPLPALLKEYLPHVQGQLPRPEGRPAGTPEGKPYLVHFSTLSLPFPTPPPEYASLMA